MENSLSLSIILASFNGEMFIKEQLDSIIPYMNSEDELIISDDGSKDRTKDIIGEYLSVYPNIHLIEGPRRGFVKNFENALIKTTKDIILFADQDDIWLPNKLPKIRDVFQQNEIIELVLHDMFVCNSVQIENKQYGTSDFHSRKRRHGFLYNALYSGYYGCCMAFKKELKQVILPFSNRVEMYDQWIGLICEYRGSSVFLQEPLIVHRIHESNMTKKLPISKSIQSKINNLAAFFDFINRTKE